MKKNKILKPLLLSSIGLVSATMPILATSCDDKKSYYFSLDKTTWQCEEDNQSVKIKFSAKDSSKEYCFDDNSSFTSGSASLQCSVAIAPESDVNGSYIATVTFKSELKESLTDGKLELHFAEGSFASEFKLTQTFENIKVDINPVVEKPFEMTTKEFTCKADNTSVEIKFTAKDSLKEYSFDDANSSFTSATTTIACNVSITSASEAGSYIATVRFNEALTSQITDGKLELHFAEGSSASVYPLSQTFDPIKVDINPVEKEPFVMTTKEFTCKEDNTSVEIKFTAKNSSKEYSFDNDNSSFTSSTTIPECSVAIAPESGVTGSYIATVTFNEALTSRIADGKLELHFAEGSSATGYPFSQTFYLIKVDINPIEKDVFEMDDKVFTCEEDNHSVEIKFKAKESGKDYYFNLQKCKFTSATTALQYNVISIEPEEGVDDSYIATVAFNSALTSPIADGKLSLVFGETQGFGLTQTFTNITVNPAVSPLVEIKVNNKPQTAFEVGDKFTSSGLTLTATFKDKSTQTITEGWTIKPYDPDYIFSNSDVGENIEVKVFYQNLSTSYCINVMKHQDVEYEFNKEKLTATVTSCRSDSNSVKVPKEVFNKQDGKKYTVTEIGKSAFAARFNLTWLHLPSTIQKIDDYAFANCIYLDSIDVSDSYSNATLPSSLTYIGEKAFYGCLLLGRIVIETTNNLTIKKSAFEECESLASVILGPNIGMIESDAFKNCTTLHDGEKDGQHGLVFTGTEHKWSKVMRYDSWLDGCTEKLMIACKKEVEDEEEPYKLVSANKTMLDDFEIKDKHDDFKTLTLSKFKHNSKYYRRVEIPSQIMINDQIYHITRLKGTFDSDDRFDSQKHIDVEEVYINEGIQTLGKYTFQEVSSLKYIHFPKTLTKIECGCIRTCDGIDDHTYQDHSGLEFAGSAEGWKLVERCDASDYEHEELDWISTGSGWYEVKVDTVYCVETGESCDKDIK